MCVYTMSSNQACMLSILTATKSSLTYILHTMIVWLFKYLTYLDYFDIKHAAQFTQLSIHYQHNFWIFYYLQNYIPHSICSFYVEITRNLEMYRFRTRVFFNTVYKETEHTYRSINTKFRSSKFTHIPKKKYTHTFNRNIRNRTTRF